MLSRLNYRTPVNKFSPKIETDRKKPFIKFNENELETNKSLQKREKEIILRRDIIGKYLTDENNTEELVKDLRRDREKSRQFYKEINDLQYLEYQKNNINLFGTIDPLIVKRAKKKMLTEDPFSSKIKYDYWKSNLSNNPILNPENNVHYNRYLFQEEVDCNNYNGMIMNEKNRNKNYNSIDTDYRRNKIKFKLAKKLINDNNNKLKEEIMNSYNHKYNEEKTDNYNNMSNSNLSNSKYEMDLKRKFFNIDYNFDKINNNYKINKEKEINYNNHQYKPKIFKRKILRQALSSSFLH